MEKVLNQAEILAETILESDEYIAMRLAEQAAMRDEKCTSLFAAYTEKRHQVEEILADPAMDPNDLSKAGEELEAIEKAIDQNLTIKTMRAASNTFNEMMQNVNKIIRVIVNGEEDQSEEPSGCTGSCSSCGGACHKH